MWVGPIRSLECVQICTSLIILMVTSIELTVSALEAVREVQANVLRMYRSTLPGSTVRGAAEDG